MQNREPYLPLALRRDLERRGVNVDALAPLERRRALAEWAAAHWRPPEPGLWDEDQSAEGYHDHR